MSISSVDWTSLAKEWVEILDKTICTIGPNQ